MSNHAAEVTRGERFEFGLNWSRFLSALSEERIAQAERSLTDMLGVANLEGKSFLDAGSGSGLFSLAARRLGASVYSFDFDPHSVASTRELMRRYFPHDDQWTIEEASVLSEEYVRSLGKFEIVYSWGVLHHTGEMWKALNNAAIPVGDGGQLFVAIYNDQGGASRRWGAIKRAYNRMPLLRWPLLVITGGYFEAKRAAAKMARFKNPLPFKEWAAKKQSRGMSEWHDLVDWVGGYPFEVARPEEIFQFYRDRGFALEKLLTDRGHGCNQFVFRREPAKVHH